MVANLSRPQTPKAIRRLDDGTFDHKAPLETYVTSRSSQLLDLITTGGREKAKKFLVKPPSAWPLDPTYVDFQAKVRKLKVVNDVAERGVALVQAYSGQLTKDEGELQAILRLVAGHRKDYPTPNKAALKD
jgi:hypothetical protein